MNTGERRPTPYVGVSGVVCHKDIMPSGLISTEPQQLFLEAYARNAHLFDTGRLLALGVKATHKTQFQDSENKYGDEWYPVGEQAFTDALGPKERHTHSLGVAQMYLDVHHVHDAEYRHAFVGQTVRRGQKWLRAVQFDMLPWHDNDEMLEFLGTVRWRHNVKTLLQCYNQAMEELKPKGVVQKLGRFAGNIDYILFDASHGTGKRMDAQRLDGFLEEAYSSEALNGVGFAVAGGLNAAAVQEDMPLLLEKYPDLSWDAEGQLHPLNNVGKRPLQMDAAKAYLRASADVLRA